jgi:hypothetical protein
MLNHVPFFAIAFGSGILLYGWLRASGLAARMGCVLFVIAGLSAGATYLTGEGAEEVIEGQPGVMHSFIESHEAVALYALIISIVLGVGALGALVMYRKEAMPGGVSGTLLVVALVALGTMAYTANTGGKINHPELRTNVSSAQPSAGEHDED